MKSLLLDANVLLRFVTGEPADQANEVASLFTAAEAGKLRLAVLPIVLAETVFVLTGFYEHPRAQVAEVLAQLISCPGIPSGRTGADASCPQAFRHRQAGLRGLLSGRSFHPGGTHGGIV
jgi:predicted nucleic acid-binding protein